MREQLQVQKIDLTTNAKRHTTNQSMPINKKSYHDIIHELKPKKVTLVAVSKTKTVAEIM